MLLRASGSSLTGDHWIESAIPARIRNGEVSTDG
jgi:hypothetical protein